MIVMGLLAPEAAPPLIGDPAPTFELRTADGDPVGRDQLMGRVTVVEFFATWCIPCQRSLEDLRAVREQLGPDVKMLIVVVESEPRAVREYFSRRAPPPGATLVHDVRGEAARLWGKDRLPTSFFVDRGGIVRHINRGHGPGFRARAIRWLRAMLTASQ
jgi:cytochrome c biogenesis protein CcmG/thiol:disulfide interchange protein DsbE